MLWRLLSCFSCVQLFVTPRTVARQAPLSIGFSRQEYWSGLPCPLLGNHPDPGIKPSSLTSPELAGRFFTTSTTWEAHISVHLWLTCPPMWIVGASSPSGPQSICAEQGHWMQTVIYPNRWSQHGTFSLWDRTSLHHSTFKRNVPACCWTLWSASCMIDMPIIKSIVEWRRRIRYRPWLNSRSTENCVSIWLRVSRNLFLLLPPVLRLHTKLPLAAWLRNTNNNQSDGWFL